MTTQDHRNMTAEERDELRQLLKAEVADWIVRRPEFVTDWLAVLDEDSCQFYATEAEIAVFHLDEDWLPALFVAYAAYEVLIEIVDSMFPTERIGELIEKARSLCPPAQFYEFSVPYSHRCTDRQWFQWFAKEFLYIPFRQSRAFYDKVDYNLAAITTFADEEKPKSADDADQRFLQWSKEQVKKSRKERAERGEQGGDDFDDDIPF